MKRIVKNYEIQHVLGVGGMGTVYFGVEVQLRREVALKCLRPEIANNPGVMDRFRNEAQAQAKFNHPNVAHLYEFFQAGAEHFMAMEYVNGPTLSKVLEDRGRLSYDEAAEYAVQALLGLEHAHKHGIIHRDIKPANLMLNKDNQVKVTDFGIARVSGASRSTRAGMIVGTYEYISPEAAQGQPITALSDIYSMAVVLYELIAGRLPFETTNEFELLKMHIQAPRPSVRGLLKEVPGPLDDAIRRAMDANPRKRFRSAGEMAGALQACLERNLERSPKRSTPSPKSWFRSLVSDTPKDKTPQPDPPVADRRRTDISATVHRVEDLLEQHLWDEARTVLDAGGRSYPAEPELTALGTRLQKQRQQWDEGIRHHAELVRDLLSRGLPEAAMKAVRGGLAIHPGSAALLELEAECTRNVALSSAVAAELACVQKAADELIAVGKFQEATDYILGLNASSENQNEINLVLSRILQARKEAEKQAVLRQFLDDAGRAAAEHRWEAALAILDGGLARFPGDATLQNYRRELHDGWQADLHRLAVDALLAEVRSLENSGSPQAAYDRLSKVLDTMGRDAALLQELQRLEGLLGKRIKPTVLDGRAAPDPAPPPEHAAYEGPYLAPVEIPRPVSRPIATAPRLWQRPLVVLTAGVLLIGIGMAAVLLWPRRAVTTVELRQPPAIAAAPRAEAPKIPVDVPPPSPVANPSTAPAVVKQPAPEPRATPAAPPRATATPAGRLAIDSFFADRTGVRPGQSVVLRWTVSGPVRELSLTPGGILPAGSSTKEVVPTGTTVYTLTAKSPTSTVDARFQVDVIPYSPPTITHFRAEPESIAPGQTARLVWDTAGDITAIDFTPALPVTPQSRSVEVSPQATTRYRMEAVGPGGRSSETVTIEVVRRAEPAPPPPARTPVVTPPTPANNDAEARSVFQEAQKELTARHYEKAGVLFGRASKLNSRWKEPLIQKALLDSKLGLFSAVIEDCDEALRLDSNDAEAHNLRGYALSSLNRNREALVEFNHAIRLKPDYADAYTNRGNTEIALHETQNANDDFATAQSLRGSKKKR